MAVGPVDVVIIGFPGNKFTGRIAPALMELVDSGTVRVIDLLFVTKDADGVTTTIDIADLDPETGPAFLDVSVTAAGALGPEDAEEVADDLAAEQLGAPDRVRERLGGGVRRRLPRGGRRADRPDPHPRRRGRGGPVRQLESRLPDELRGTDMGLLRMAARTAVVAGTATAVSGRVAHRQAAKYDEQAAAAVRRAAPPRRAAAPEQDEQTAKLQELAQLNKQGVLSDEEFAAAKAKVLGI